VRRATSGTLLAVLGFASWGLMTPVGKLFLVRGDFGPLGLNAVRFGLATLVLLPALGWQATRDGVRLLADRRVLWSNVLANASLTAFLYALTYLPPTFPTLGFYTAPLWTAMLARAWLGERVGPWFLPAALGLLAGGYLALFGWAAPHGQVSGFGMALAVGSGVLWAVYSVVLRKAAPALPLKPLMAASFLVGGLYFVALALAFEGVPRLWALSGASWAWLAVYVAIPTLASFILFNAALQRAEASTVNVLVGVELAATALFSLVVPPGQRFSVAQAAGLLIVLASVTAYVWLHGHGARPAATN